MPRISCGRSSNEHRSPFRRRRRWGMLTDRGRWILAFGGAVYLAAWAFGTTALYPIGLGLVLAVAAAALWVRLLNRPMRVNRTLGRESISRGTTFPSGSRSTSAA